MNSILKKQLISMAIIFILIIVLAFAAISRSKVAINFAWLTLAFFGFYMLITSLYQLLKSAKSKIWPTINYKIIKHTIFEHANSDSINPYSPSIEIQYQLSGKTYTKFESDDNNQRFFINKELAQDYIDQFIKRPSKIIYYDPNNPAKSFIYPKIRFETIASIIIGLGLMAFGISNYLGLINWA